MSRMEVALAQAIVSAITQARDDGQSCNINLRPCVATSVCAPRNGVCRGPGVDGVIPCCIPGQTCFRRTDTESGCRSSSGPPSFFLGGIDAFPVCPAEIDE